jgi:4-hydroxy-tetrahydrodipicolinate synthase
MDRNDINWEGNFTAVVTPFTKDGQFDRESFCSNIDLLIREGLDGVIVTGCTGEFWSMTDEERVEAYQLAVDTAQKKVPVIAGTMDKLTHRVIQLSKEAKRVGCDGIMVTPPYYILSNEREVLEHFEQISSNVDLPILVYNIPKRVGINTSPKLLSELADIEHVVAVKQSSPTFEDVVETVRLCTHKIKVFAGHSVTRGYPCLVMGCDGYVSSVETQVMGKEAIQLYKLSVTGEHDQARELQYRLIELDKAVHGIGTFPAALKAAMNICGRPGGFPRSPIMALTEKEIAQVRNTLKELNVL